MRRTLLVVVLLAAVAVAVSAHGRQAASSSQATIQDLIRQTADAMSKKDVATWEKVCDPSIVVFEMGTKQNGWEDFRDNHIKKEYESAKEATLDWGQIQVHPVSSEFAWATSEGSFKVTMKDGTVLQSAKLLASWALQKKAGAWKVVHVHFSWPPSPVS